jgi:hypothetical protein
MAKGVDSLFLYVDCQDIFGWDVMVKKIDGVEYDECFKINKVDFVKIKAWIKSFPQCIQSSQFMIFLNVKSCYVRVLSLGFELYGFDKIVLNLCDLLEKITGKHEKNWLDCLRVSRIDCYCDFAFNGDFDFDLFRTKLRKKGIFKSSDDVEGITYYFGSRDLMMVRLYTKSAEIKHSSKDYLKSAWEKDGCKNDKIWRLEFEFHKLKIEEITRFRELVNIQGDEIKKLFAYGLDSLEYVEASGDSNFARRELSPIWKRLKAEFNGEYSISKKQVKKANIEFRRKLARRRVMSWLISKNIEFSEISEMYISDFNIIEKEYNQALNAYRIGLK